MADGGHLEKMAAQKGSGRDILWIICWIGFKFGSLGISNDLINFREEPIKNNMAGRGYFVIYPDTISSVIA